mgnify:CR=1 FL=1
MSESSHPAQVGSNAGLGGSAEHWPTNADEVRGFVGNDYCSLKYGRQDQSPDDNDIYTMSAHDLVSAIQSWRRFVLGHDA